MNLPWAPSAISLIAYCSLPFLFLDVEGIKDTKADDVFGSYIPTGNPLEYWQAQTKKFGNIAPFPKKSL